MQGFKTALLLGVLTGILMLLGHLAGGAQGASIMLVVSLGMSFFSYWFSDSIVLAMHRARELGPEELPWLHATVERLAARAGIPKPRVYIMADRSANAFATGRSPSHAAVCVTSGLLEVLEPDEVEGVLAHELGHVRNRDILIATVAAAIAGAIGWFAYILQWGGFSRSRDDRDGGGLGLVGLLLATILAPIVATLVQLAVSRSREYAADETGAEISGRPGALARALAKIAHVSEVAPVATATSGTAHLFIANPFGGARSWFATHPPIEERIRRLEALALAPLPASA